MQLYVEGLDRCGKDTLINQLRQVILTPRIQVTHESKPPKDVNFREWAIEHYDFMLRQQRDFESQNITAIYNRSHLGETVWGPLYRKYNADFIFDSERHYISSLDNAYLILLTDSAERLMDRDDGLSLTKSIEELNQVRNLFCESFEKSSIRNKIHIKLEEVKFEDVFPIAMEFLNANSK